MEEINEEIVEEPIKVYVKVNENNEIIDIGSSIFIDDIAGWVEIDSGFGDKYAHAQSQYFKKPLINEDGDYNYIFQDNIVKEV